LGKFTSTALQTGHGEQLSGQWTINKHQTVMLTNLRTLPDKRQTVISSQFCDDQFNRLKTPDVNGQRLTAELLRSGWGISVERTVTSSSTAPNVTIQIRHK
jgi:hypothetical protein